MSAKISIQDGSLLLLKRVTYIVKVEVDVDPCSKKEYVFHKHRHKK